MRTLGVTSSVAVSGLLVAVLAGPATADSHSSGWVDQDDGEIEVGAEGGGGEQDGSDIDGASSQPICEWERVPEDSTIYRRWASTADDFVLYYVDCLGEPRDIVEVPVDDDGSAPSAAVARERAVERLVLPSPRIELNPAEPVVHVETWLWVDGFRWEGVSETASAGGVTATIVATPRDIVWDMGNGEQVVCDGPGQRYDPKRSPDEQQTDCSYTYRHSSADQPGEAYQVTATVEWTVEWSVTGAAGGGPLPAMFTSAPVPVRVAEMQALNR